MKWSGVVGLVLTLIVAGCSGDDDGSKADNTTAAPSTTSAPETQTEDGGPGDVMRDLIGYQSLGQYGRVWDLLHQAHQEIASRSFYEGCAREVGASSGDVEVKVIEVYDDPIDIPAIPEKKSKAVTYRIRLSGTDATQTETSHLVDVDGKWRWVLAPDDVRYYKRGECPP